MSAEKRDQRQREQTVAAILGIVCVLTAAGLLFGTIGVGIMLAILGVAFLYLGGKD